MNGHNVHGLTKNEEWVGRNFLLMKKLGNVDRGTFCPERPGILSSCYLMEGQMVSSNDLKAPHFVVDSRVEYYLNRALKIS